jgi:deazaflavin-dependent oxidoreductase (nitroreductase family)
MASNEPLRERVLKVMNGFPILVLKSPIHGVLSGNILLITFKGKKSGKVYATPVNYILDGDTVLITTDSVWWKNLRGSAPVTVRIKGKDYAGVGEAVTDHDACAEAIRAMINRFPNYGKWANIGNDADGKPVAADIDRAVRDGRVLVRVQLAEAPAPARAG